MGGTTFNRSGGPYYYINSTTRPSWFKPIVVLMGAGKLWSIIQVVQAEIRSAIILFHSSWMVESGCCCHCCRWYYCCSFCSQSTSIEVNGEVSTSPSWMPTVHVDLRCSAGSNVDARDDDALTGLLSRYRKNLLFLNMTI